MGDWEEGWWNGEKSVWQKMSGFNVKETDSAGDWKLPYS